MKIINLKLKIRSGFTLVELLVAVSILVFVLAAAVKVEIDNIKLASKNEHVLVATNLAQEQLNLIKTVRDNNPPNEPFNDFDVTQTLKLIIPGNQLKPLDSQDITNSGYKVRVGDKDYFVKIQVTDVN